MLRIRQSAAKLLKIERINMSSELEDFEYFKANQLANIDFTT